MIPRLVPEQAVVSAVSLNSVAMQSSTLVGPLIGGILIATIGPGGVMLVNAVAAVIMFLALLAMRPMPVAPLLVRQNVFAAVGEGISYIVREPVLRWTMGLFVLAAILARPYAQLMPAYAHDVLHVGAIEFSWLLAASGLGAVVGSTTTASLGFLRRRGVVVAISTASLGALLMGVALTHTLVPALLLLPLASFAASLSLAMSMTIFQMRAVDRVRGRVMGVAMMTLSSFMPLGTSLLGALATKVGVNAAIMFGSTVVCWAAWWHSSCRSRSRRFGGKSVSQAEPVPVVAAEQEPEPVTPT